MKIEKKYQVWLHIAYSLIFLSIPFLSSPDFPDYRETLSNPMGRTEVISQLYLLGFFYICYLFLIPKYFLRKKYLNFSLLSLLFASGILLLPFIILSHHPHPHPPMDGPPPGFRPPHRHWIPPGLMMAMSKNLYQLFLVMAVAMLISVSRKWKETEKEKLNAELSYLKAQINPHFLFNTLNSVYSLAIEENAVNTSDAMVRLSDMMRYIINEAEKNYVGLKRELEYISSYIKLQSYRFGNTVRLETEIVTDDNDEIIAPLILIPYIENAFKYGVNPSKNSTIIISIHVKNGVLKLHVENNKVNDTVEPTSGIGMENTRNRLELLYPGKHSLIIVDAEKFIINLELQLR